MNAKSEYMLLFAGTEWYNEVSPAEAKKISEQAKAWFEGLLQRGCVKGGHGLARTGTHLTAKTGRVISDGPYPESKEVVGGYMIVEAESLEEAVAMAKGNPTIAYGTSIDVRPAFQGEENCPLYKRARMAELEPAAA
ncbi:MAG TPA: YciI family protein [Verrucomicrobiae bacterium]|jgi:hypothetical protein|nr:YciI family protein [Verrucomicrobiae bacterium]